MESLFELISYLGILSLIIPLITFCLTWLFIRSAVASGTKQGIIDAYHQINGKETQEPLDDFEAEMKGWE